MLRPACRPQRYIFSCSNDILSPSRLLWRQNIRYKGIFSNIVDSVKKEASKDEELQKSVKKFEERLTDVRQNQSLQSIKDTLSKTKKEVLDQNQALFTDLKDKAAQLQKTTVKAAETISAIAEPVKEYGKKIVPNIDIHKISNSEGMKTVSRNIVRVQETIVDEDESYRYGGFMSKELRDKKRLENTKVDTHSSMPAVDEDPNAGGNVIIHKESAWLKKWRDFKDDNIILKNLFDFKRTYDESNNLFVYYMRSLTNVVGDAFGSLFRENERAQVIREITQLDPTFKLETFLKQTREYIIPDILEAHLNANLSALKPWCSEGVFNVFKANLDAIRKSNVSISGRVLDLRNVDLHTAKLLDDYPVLVISFNTQQIRFVKDSSGKVVEGSEDKVEHVFYVWALAKCAEMENRDITGGWKLIEMASRDANSGF